MKTIHNLHLLITLILTLQTNISFGITSTIAKGAINVLCSTAELFLSCAPFIDKCKVTHNNLSADAELLKDMKSNAPEAVINFVTKIAHSRGLNDMKVILNGDHHCYAMRPNIILIPDKKALKLEELLNKLILNSEEQEELNLHIADLHHELTHEIRKSHSTVPIYNAAIGTIGAMTTSAIVTQAVHKYLPNIQKQLATHNTLKIGRGALTLSLACNLINMKLYEKYDELKADDGIPNQKELLSARIKDHQECHGTYQTWIHHIKNHISLSDIISPPADRVSSLEDNPFTQHQTLAIKIIPKNLFNKPLIVDTVFHARSEHPSHLRRMLYFQKRLKNIDLVAATGDQKEN